MTYNTNEVVYARVGVRKGIGQREEINAVAEIHSLSGQTPYFSLTGTTYLKGREEMGGCIHEEIAKHYPELTPFIRWHLFSAEGGMHYLANTAYHAGNRDYNGRAAGEASAWEHGVRFGNVPVTHRIKRTFFEFLKEANRPFQVVAVSHGNKPGEYAYSDNYTVEGFAARWHECPFKDKTEAEEFCAALNNCSVEFVEIETQWSEGKTRDLDAARSTAYWPDATDEELTAPGLEDRLKARLPKLVEEWRGEMARLFSEVLPALGGRGFLHHAILRDIGIEVPETVKG